ncbi:hypothetical protein ISF6_2043 [Piscinibacter sakaiensis]|uniref:Uncharacterized protein n=1 Tax=Piscinibacter sakaiensis TaxID=1547922 RepID=A0A0K8P0P9_PISS1|nr:hypothetical protein ISF6_2043 [Piscinibacter sakaiensis]
MLTLAQLLEQLEAGPRAPAPQQYRSVVEHLGQELRRLDGDEALPFVLEHFPATATVYENLRYEQAGLCRSPLELSLNTETRARELIARLAARGEPPRTAAGSSDA